MAHRGLLGARVLAPAVLGVGGTGSGLSYLYVNETYGEDAVRRTMSFYSVAVPALVAYKGLEWRCYTLPNMMPGFNIFQVHNEDADRMFEALHEKWAPKFRDKYLELRGFYLKQGQGIANNVADLFPKKWQKEMEPLLDRVPAAPASKVRNIIQKELRLKDIKDEFSYFEAEPLGSASIGQVHRAVWKGKKCVVKVQYPEVEKTFRGDVFAVKQVCKDMFPQYYVAFEEIERQFATEFDYRGEAKNATDIRANLIRSRKFDRDFVVPEIYAATKRVLIMEEIEHAVPLTQALRATAQSEADRRGMDLASFVAEEEARDLEAAERGKLVSNSFWTRLALYFGLVQNVPLDPASLIDKLLAVHGHQVLVDGLFSSDPHPGNVLLASTRRGELASTKNNKIALVDFGQAKRLDLDTRLRVAELVLLVDAALKSDPRTTGDSEPSKRHLSARRAVAQAMIAAGFRTQNNNPDCLYEMASVYFGRDDRVWIYPRNFQQWTDHVQSLDPVQNLDQCQDFVMIVRCAMLIRGLGHLLHEHRTLSSAWKPIAESLLAHHGRLAPLRRQIAAL